MTGVQTCALPICAFEIGPAIPPLAARRAGVNLNLSFAAQAGVGYRLERSSDLFSWSLHETIGVLPTNGVVQRTIPPTQTQQYFRLSLDF